MMNVFLVRHGRSDANDLGIIQGQTVDSPLTREGEAQMVAVAEFLRGVVHQVPLVWYHSQQRVTASAFILASQLSGELRESRELIQRSWGNIEGQSISAGERVDAEAAYYGEPGDPIAPDAELLSSVRQRLERFISLLFATAAETNIIVSHDEIINYLANIWTGQWLKKYRIANGEVVRVIFDPHSRVTERPRIVFPQRLVYCLRAPTFFASTTAKSLLADHDLVLVNQDSDIDKSLVAIIVLGDVPFTPEDAKGFRGLRAVCRFGAGIDGIAASQLRAHGIHVAKLKATGARAIAQYVLGMAILLIRDYPEQSNGLRAKPLKWRAAARAGVELQDSTIGIVGLGQIGLCVAKVLRDLNANVIAYNRTWPEALARSAEALGISRVRTLRALCARADIISVHTPLTDATRRIIDRDLLDVIHTSGRRPGLINTSRGEVINEDALIDALDKGWLRGAALDVWSTERDSASDTVARLREHPLVLPTPHIAGYSSRAIEAAILQCAQNVVALAGGRVSEADCLITTFNL